MFKLVSLNIVQTSNRRKGRRHMAKYHMRVRCTCALQPNQRDPFHISLRHRQQQHLKTAFGIEGEPRVSKYNTILTKTRKHKRTHSENRATSQQCNDPVRSSPPESLCLPLLSPLGADPPVVLFLVRSKTRMKI